MTLAQGIFFGAWAIGGLPLGLAAGVLERREDGGDDSIFAGFLALMVWGIAPVVAALGVVAGLAWLMNRAVSGVDHARPSREQLEARIAELERTVDLGADDGEEEGMRTVPSRWGSG